MHRLVDLAAEVGGRVEGDGEAVVRDLRTLPDAGPDDLAPLFSAAYREQARDSRAGAFLVPEDHAGLTAGLEPRPLLVVDHPSHAMARLLEHLHPPRRPEPGVHPTAVVEEGAQVHASAHVGPYAVIGAGSRLEAGVVVEALAVVGRGCRIGADTRLRPHAVLYDDTVLGAGCQVHSGAVVGGDGFGYATRQGTHHKVPQVGRAVIGDDVEIGVNSAVDRGALGDTEIGAGSKIDNLVQVGHNVRTGKGVLLCGQSGIGGSTVLGDHVVLGGKAGVVDHVEVGDRTQAAADSAILTSVGPDLQMAGSPAVEIGRWRRQTALLRRLEEMSKRLRRLEKAVEREQRNAPEPDGDGAGEGAK